MSSNNNDYITTSDAFKRLGENPPGNSTFYRAVSDGKIIKAPADKSDPNGPTLVSWSSVQEWNKSRIPRQGNRAKQKQGKEPEGDPVSPPLFTAAHPTQPAGSSGSQENSVATGIIDSTAEKLPAPEVVHQGNDQPKTVMGQPKSKPAKSQNKSRTSSPPPESAPNVKASSKKRAIPLRKFKNMLRQLPFGQSLDLRNWLDNRLLYKLKPETSTPIGATSESTEK